MFSSLEIMPVKVNASKSVKSARLIALKTVLGNMLKV